MKLPMPHWSLLLLEEDRREVELLLVLPLFITWAYSSPAESNEAVSANFVSLGYCSNLMAIVAPSANANIVALANLVFIGELFKIKL